MASKSAKRRQKRRRRAAEARAARGAPEAPGSAAATGTEPATAATSSPPRRRKPARARRDIDHERPPPPWGSFPLIELTVLIGIVMLLAGFLFVGGTRGGVMVGVGLLLASIAGLELAVREHFAGYRSHTTILSLLPAAVVLGILFFAGPEGLPPLARLAIGLAVLGGAALLLTRIFRNRSGGHSFRFATFTRR